MAAVVVNAHLAINVDGGCSQPLSFIQWGFLCQSPTTSCLHLISDEGCSHLRLSLNLTFDGWVCVRVIISTRRSRSILNVLCQPLPPTSCSNLRFDGCIPGSTSSCSRLLIGEGRCAATSASRLPC